MNPSLEELISPELLAAARRIFDGVETAIPVYLPESGGSVRIGGGSAGPQTIETLELDADTSAWMQSVLVRLDQLLDLDFTFSASSNRSKINVYLDTEINLGGGGTTLGVALSNEYRRSSWWEVILNGPPLLKDPAYLRFAFIHELGHVLGLEHPFDGSDGDLGGERFGDPDASVTVMSYTRPPDAWPDFYRPQDLAALVSVWGLESDVADWLIETADGEVQLLERLEAERQLTQEPTGSTLLGPAPDPPQQLRLSPTDDPRWMRLEGLTEQARWEFSWDGGRSWTSSDDLAVAMPDQRRQLNLRQRDRWGRLSPELVVLVGPGLQEPITVGPELLLPGAGAAPTGLQAWSTGPTGDPVLFWALDPALAAQANLADAIRAAAAELDGLVGLDLVEQHPSETHDLVQLQFKAASGDAETLISLDRQRRTLELDGQELLLDDRLNVTLTADNVPTDSLRAAVFQAFGLAAGLQPADAALAPGTSVMGPLQQWTVATGGGSFTALDRAALIQLLGSESDPGPTELSGVERERAWIQLGNADVHVRDVDSGESTTIVERAVQRSGNLDLRLPLVLQAGSEQLALILEPGQTEAAWRLELPTGSRQQLSLDVVLPAQAALEAGSESIQVIDLHSIEFSLTTQELIDQRWLTEENPWSDGLITWQLAPELEEAWGQSLRSLLQAIDRACGLTLVEAAASDSQASWTFVPQAATRSASERPRANQRTFELAAQPLQPATGREASNEQALLQDLLISLGLERPDNSTDGDAYHRTPVLASDSALFTSLDDTHAGQAALQWLDAAALRQIHGEPEPTAAGSSELQLRVVEEQSGLGLGQGGLQRKLGLELNRSGSLSARQHVLIRQAEMDLAVVVSLEAGQADTTVLMPWPETLAGDLWLEPVALGNGGLEEPAGPLVLDENQLNGLGNQARVDPITGWSPDLDGNGRVDVDLEGLLLTRFGLGTFPGDSLINNLSWPTQAAGAESMALAADTRATQTSDWLNAAAGPATDSINAFALMLFLHSPQGGQPKEGASHALGLYADFA